MSARRGSNFTHRHSGFIQRHGEHIVYTVYTAARIRWRERARISPLSTHSSNRRATGSLSRVNAYQAGLQRSMIIKIDKTRGSVVRKYRNRPSTAVIVVGDPPRDIPRGIQRSSCLPLPRNAAYAADVIVTRIDSRAIQNLSRLSTLQQRTIFPWERYMGLRRALLRERYKNECLSRWWLNF